MGEDVIEKEMIQSCVETWRVTLRSFGITRSLNPREEHEIGRAIQRWGVEMVELALFGARLEPKTEHFDPANYVCLRRVFGKDKHGSDLIENHANRGSKKRRNEVPAKAEDPKEETYVTDPNRVREILKKAFK